MAKNSTELAVAPDIKKPFDATIPSLPAAAMLLPILLYGWMAWNMFTVGKNYYHAYQEKAVYPSHVAQKQQLDTKITAYRTVLSDADSQFANFRLWKGWLLEGPPVAQLISAVLNAIQGDVRITTLRFNKSLNYPTQLELTCRLALTQTDPTNQFEMVMKALDSTGWRVGGSVDQSADPDAARLYPTPNGAPREVFYKLEAKINQRIDAANPNVPISVPLSGPGTGSSSGAGPGPVNTPTEEPPPSNP